jgi:hypothetical protein
MAVGHADLARLGIHRSDPVLDRSGRAFGQHHRAVICGDGGHAVKQVVHRYARVFGEEHGRALAVPLAESLRPHTEDPFTQEAALVDPFESEESRHHLGDRRRHEPPVYLPLIENLAACGIEQIGDRRIGLAGNGGVRHTLRAKRRSNAGHCHASQ